MRVDFHEEIALQKIHESGQCFRWKAPGDGSFLIPAFGRFVTASQVSATAIELSCSEDEYEEIWRDYFDADTSYSGIIKNIPKDDTFLTDAARVGSGIRILKQEPFEVLISFIISQRRNIPSIRSCVEKLCASCGKVIGNYHGEKIFSFPGPAAIAESDLSDCSLGYRMPYVKSAAREFVSVPQLTERLSAMSDEELQESLLSFYGVGIKVCSCTMLFGFHRMNAFPVDVWMKRALSEHYPAGFDFERHYPYNGVIQQYIFAYYRGMNTAGQKASGHGE